MMLVKIFSAVLLLYFANPNPFIFEGYWLLGWVWAIPFISVLDNASIAKRLLIGLLFGLTFYALLVHWFIPYTAVGYVFFVMALLIQPLIFSLFARGTSSRPLTMLFGWPAIWGLSEMIRSHWMSGFQWGLSYSQAFHLPAIQITSILGSFGLGVVMLFFQILIYLGWKKTLPRWRCWGAAVMIYAVVSVYGAAVLKKDDVPLQQKLAITVIQANIPPKEKIDGGRVQHQLDKHMTLTQRALKESQPSLIVWPETAVATDFINRVNIRKPLDANVTSSQVSHLIGGAISKDGKSTNSAALLSVKAPPQVYTKQYLIPFSEYMPSGKFWERLKESLNIKHYQFASGDGPVVMDLKGRAGAVLSRFGVLICNEDTIGFLYRDYARRGAQWVAVLLNDGWFSEKTALRMHAQNAVMNAVQSGLPVVRAANTGWSCHIDRRGRIDSGGIELQSTGTATFQVAPANAGSFYSKYEWWINVIFVVWGVTAILLSLGGFRQLLGYGLFLLTIFMGQAVHAGGQLPRQPPPEVQQQLRDRVSAQREAQQAYIRQQQEVQRQIQLRVQQTSPPAAAPPVPEKPKVVYPQPQVLSSGAGRQSLPANTPQPAARAAISQTGVSQELMRLIQRFESSSQMWTQIEDARVKAMVISYFIDLYSNYNIYIRKPSVNYVMLINSMSQNNPEMLLQPMDQILRVVAIIEYDYDDGSDPNALALEILGNPQAVQQNRARLEL